MFGQEFQGHSPVEHTNNRSSTSYTFGPHHERSGEYIYYTLDNRIVQQDPERIPVVQEGTPAWVIADLMLCAHRGQPLSEAERQLCAGPHQSPSLIWLQKSLFEFSK
jgi:hypothetical protein|tara:strand:+ start:1247 stop:1567 length:321 start_codon:yes stop_codon:yes gene_type:complete